MSKEPKVESILWSTANVVKLAVFIAGMAGGFYTIIRHQDQTNADLVAEIQSLREDLNVYVAEAKGKNDLQDLMISQQVKEIADLRAMLMQSREATKPKQVVIESE